MTKEKAECKGYCRRGCREDGCRGVVEEEEELLWVGFEVLLVLLPWELSRRELGVVAVVADLCDAAGVLTLLLLIDCAELGAAAVAVVELLSSKVIFLTSTTGAPGSAVLLSSCILRVTNRDWLIEGEKVAS